MTEKKEKRSVNIEIQIDEPTAMGQYVNMVVVQHSHSEFVLDYIFIPPGQTKAKVKSRIILSPEHAKRLLSVLRENVSLYEKRFGEIKLPEPPTGLPESRTVQ